MSQTTAANPAADSSLPSGGLGAGTPVAKKPTPRVPLWDNARFVCVTLVVVGHGIQRLTADSNNALSLYLFIYAFHVPAFAFISGYFSKSGAPTARQLRSVLTDILLPYFVMEIIWTLVQFLVEGKQGFNPTTASWTLWFLLALGIFRLILPYLALVKWPLLWSVVFSIGVGYLDNVDSTFSLARAIGLLPFFVLGWKVKEWGLIDRWCRVERTTWWIRSLAITVFAVWLAIVVVFTSTWREVDVQVWFFYDRSYASLGEDQWWAGLVRLALIALATALIFAFLVLIPRSNTWFTPFGQATMYVYLLHSFVLYPLRETGVLTGANGSLSWLVSMVLACFAISIALSSPVVRRVFRPIVEPRLSWLFVKQEDAGPSPRDPTNARRR